MLLSGGSSPKRHVAWSNSPEVGRLSLTGKLRGWNPKSNRNAKTYRSYVDAAGRTRFEGTQHLKRTQRLDCFHTRSCTRWSDICHLQVSWAGQQYVIITLRPYDCDDLLLTLSVML